MMLPSVLVRDGQQAARKCFILEVEALASALRSAGRPDAAQALENRTAEEWDRCFELRFLTDILYGGEHLPSNPKCAHKPHVTLYDLFLWEDSPEGEDFWSDLVDVMEWGVF